MKKTVSLILAVLIIFLTCLPIAYAVDINNDEGMYEIDSSIAADAYMLIDLNHKNTVIAQKNKDKVKFPASLTKIVTTMVTLNHVKDLQQSTTVSQHAIDVVSGRDAQVAGLKAGESITIEQLLYLTMVHSACDACQVLAETVAKNEAEFADMMNEWAASIGCKNTHFTNPDGLHDDNHYTTAADMMLITLEAIKNETFVKISTTTSYTYGETTFIHTNFMLDKDHTSYYYEYAKGIKTGSTTQAGYCVITMAEKENRKYLAIVMDSPSMIVDGVEGKGSFIDAKAIFEWAFAMKEQTVAGVNTAVKSIAVLDGKDVDAVDLVPAEDVTALVPENFNADNIVIEPQKMPENLKAPVNTEDTVCTAKITYNGKIIGTTKLVAANEVKLNLFSRIFRVIGEFIKNHTVIFIILIIVVLIALFLIIQAVRRKKAKKRIEQRRKERAARARNRQNRDYYDY